MDVPRHLAVVTSAVIRSSKGQQHRRKSSETPDKHLEGFVAKCFEVEETALHKVSQMASHASENAGSSSRNPPSPITARFRRPSVGSKAPPSSHKPRKLSRPFTAPSQSDLSDNARGQEGPSDASLPSSPVSNSVVVPRLRTRVSNTDISGQSPSSPEDQSGTWSRRKHKLLNTRSTSTYSIPSYTTAPTKTELQAEASDDNKKKKGILRGILTRR